MEDQENSAQVVQETGSKASRQETPFEALADVCSMLVALIFIQLFLAQNFVIPSGSMENTLLVGDHLVVDRVTLAPAATWMPLVRYREPQRGDIVVFIKPFADEVNGKPEFQILVKRLIALPGDRIHLHNGIVILNGVAQSEPYAQPTTLDNYEEFVDEFPAVQPNPLPGNYIPEEWAIDLHNHVDNGDLVVPAGEYFMMGDNRHNSADSRFWGFVPRENVIGRPLFNYWSFKSTDEDYEQTGPGAGVAWLAHIVKHFVPDTRWSRTLHVVR